MMKSLFLPIAAVAIFITVVGILVKSPGKLGIKTPPTPTSTPTPDHITVGGKGVTITLADTAEKRSRGLAGTSYLPADSGMLFTFDTPPTTARFWMKDMVIPLDIIWIANKKVVGIDKNVPAPSKDTPDVNLQIYNSPGAVDYVLEVNSGFSSLNNISIGDTVTIP